VGGGYRRGVRPAGDELLDGARHHREPARRTRSGCSAAHPGSGPCWADARPWSRSASEEVLRSSPSRRPPHSPERICRKQLEHRDVVYRRARACGFCAERATARRGRENSNHRAANPAAHPARAPLMHGRELARAELEDALDSSRRARQDSPWTGRSSWAGSRASTGSTSSRSPGGFILRLSPNTPGGRPCQSRRYSGPRKRVTSTWCVYGWSFVTLYAWQPRLPEIP